MDANVRVLTLNVLVYGLLTLVQWAASRNPDAPWVQWLYVRQFGPRTDTANMTPAEHFRSARVFLLWFAAILGLFLVNAFTGPPPPQVPGWRMALSFVSALFGLMWLGGAVWVSVLGVVAWIRGTRPRQGR